MMRKSRAGRFKLGVLGIVIGMASAVFAERPNIVLIMADDLGYECLGANGESEYSTPNLDELAENGVRFEHAYSQPLCTPSRVKIMTGVSNARNYITFGVLDPEATTFGNVLKSAGYATAIAGKWQLGVDPEQVNRFGFDEFCLWHLVGKGPRYNNVARLLTHEEKKISGGYGPERVNDFVLDFITRNQNQPFFCYYPMMLPHAPFEPTPDSASVDADEKSNFKDMVAYMDQMVGRVAKRLDELGLRENTLILFTGDNGTHGSIVSRFNGEDVRGGKGSMADVGTRVPLVAHWPAGAPAGRVDRELLDFSDFLPTFAELAKVEIPEGLRLDGVSFAGRLSGERVATRETARCWYSSGGTEPSREWIRDKRFKLYRNGDFFDVAKDPAEKTRLRPDQLDEVATVSYVRLKEKMAFHADDRPARLKKTLDQLDTKRANKKKSSYTREVKPK